MYFLLKNHLTKSTASVKTGLKLVLILFCVSIKMNYDNLAPKIKFLFPLRYCTV